MEKTIFEALENIKKYDLRKDLEETVVKPLREKFLREERERLSKQQKIYAEESEIQREKLWGLKKEVLVLAGLIFGSSLALAIGRQPNPTFIFGTGLLLFTILIGLFITNAEIESRRWITDFLQLADLEIYLILNKEMIGSEEKNMIDSQIEILKEKNKRKGFSEKFLRVTRIKIDWLHKIFYAAFIFALFFIWTSLFVN